MVRVRKVIKSNLLLSLPTSILLVAMREIHLDFSLICSPFFLPKEAPPCIKFNAAKKDICNTTYLMSIGNGGGGHLIVAI